jgi:hypothetical protein
LTHKLGRASLWFRDRAAILVCVIACIAYTPNRAVSSGVPVVTESGMVDRPHGFIGNAFYENYSVDTRGDRRSGWKLEGRLNAHICPFENNHSTASLFSGLPSVAYIRGIYRLSERLTKQIGCWECRDIEQFGGVHGGLVSRVHVLNLKFWATACPTFRGEHLCVHRGNPSALLQLHGLVRGLSCIRCGVGSAFALIKNEKSGNEVGGRDKSGSKSQSAVSYIAAFIVLVCGLVIVDKFLKVIYFDVAINGYFAVGGYLIGFALIVGSGFWILVHAL